MANRMNIDAAKSAGLIAYFGYGSLVNRDTHRTQIVDAIPARLSGWRRIWQPQEDGQFTDRPLLTVFPHLETHIDGLLVIDKAENLFAVDQREINYERVEISADALDLCGSKKQQALIADIPIFLYVAAPVAPIEGSRRDQIIQSYLDAVMQGYLREFGENGVLNFMTSTDAFTDAIRNDRSNPDYPRSVQLTEHEIQLFDQMIAEYCSC